MMLAFPWLTNQSLASCDFESYHARHRLYRSIQLVLQHPKLLTKSLECFRCSPYSKPHQIVGYQNEPLQYFEPFLYQDSDRYGKFGFHQKLLTIRFAILQLYHMKNQMAFQSSNG